MRTKAGIIGVLIGTIIGVCVIVYVIILPGSDTDIVKSNVNDFSKYYGPYGWDIEQSFPDYKLPLDINNIVNFNEVIKKIHVKPASELIQKNGFAVVEIRNKYRILNLGFVNAYGYLESLEAPAFVTSDTGLYLYYTMFNQILQDIEERLFVKDIESLTKALLDDAVQNFIRFDGDIKEAAMRNIAYLTVAHKLIDPYAPISELVDDKVSSELAKIEVHEEKSQSDIFIYEEDYSQYVPRGHYTNSESLKRYFKTMMWYGRMTFLLKGGSGCLISEYDAKIQTIQAAMLAISLKNVKVGERTGLDIWDRTYKVNAFFAGLSDKITPRDFLSALEKVLGNQFDISLLADEKKLFELKKELTLLPSPKIYSGIGDTDTILKDIEPFSDDSLNAILDKTKGMRLMGRSFVPDSYIFQHLVTPEVGPYIGDAQNLPFTAGKDNFGGYCRGYIRGLDLMALLGSKEAKNILDNDGDTNYRNYEEKFDELKKEFDVLSPNQWNRNLYWSWLYCLKALIQEMPQGYPNFMQTQAWQRSNLNTALASWTQLRHETILTVEQPYGAAPPAGKLPPPPTPPTGYIEPNPVFWGRLLSLVQMTSQGLESMKVLTPDAQEKLNRFEKFIQQILEIVKKQFISKSLSEEDSDLFKKLSFKIDYILSIDEVNEIKWKNIVSDVYTNPLEKMVVEEGIGNVNYMVVACPLTEDWTFLAVGPVFSYYEFKQSMSNRLTDEQWQKMFDSPQKPERPKWYIPLMH